jgi:chemotaxis protein CheD
VTNLVIKDEDLVSMGGIGVRRDEGILRTLLGSCIGVALYERRLRLVGLAHVVMPNSMGRTDALGKYADTAIPETIRQLLKIANVQRLELSAKIAGGANMFANISPVAKNPMGDQNTDAVESALKKWNIPITARHLGGSAGRRMIVHLPTGMVQIHVVGQTVVEI